MRRTYHVIDCPGISKTECQVEVLRRPDIQGWGGWRRGRIGPFHHHCSGDQSGEVKEGNLLEGTELKNTQNWQISTVRLNRGSTHHDSPGELPFLE
mgnify:CR=1 FL=1